MTLEEAKAHMIGVASDWSYYIEKMDAASRKQMVAEQRKLMRAGWSVNTPFQYATAAHGDELLGGAHSKTNFSVDRERSAGGDATPAASRCKVCGDPVPNRNFNCCSDSCYREAYL